jgi:multidrug efflux pump subunit AcrB
MWIVKLALSRPYTFIVAALLVLILSVYVVMCRMSTDIFPNINIPVVSIIWNYTGFAPQDMEQRIVSVTERALTTTVNDIEHIESQSMSGIAVVKVFFHPNVKIDMAVAQITAVSQTQLKQLPTGTTPPLIIVYNASSVPIIQLSTSSQVLAEQNLFDLSVNTLRPRLATIQGAAIPWPYGGKQRQIMVDLDIQALQANGLTATDVVNALGVQNLTLPSGTAKIGDKEYQVQMNGSPLVVEELNNLPIKVVNGAMIYIRDVAHVRDGFSPQTNVVRQDGVRSTLMSIMKNGDTSTLDIVSNVKSMLPQLQALVPKEMEIRTLFDQSIFVRSAIEGVIKEGVIAACLTAVMILLFLGDWRSTMIIALSIPLSVLSSILILNALGETINIMTLGGLALAVGILVDDATVTIENIDQHLDMGKPLHQAILDGAHQIAVPAFVSTLCICIVFIPMFMLSGVARFLFVPLAEAVAFAVLSSYVISRTVVPTLAMYLLKHSGHKSANPGFFARLQHGFENGFLRLRQAYQLALAAILEHQKMFAVTFLAGCLGSLALIPFLGEDFFPTVDAGQFKLHVRAETGTRIEETAKLCNDVEDVIRRVIPKEELTGILDNIGLPYSGINTSYSNSGTVGSADGEILVSLSKEHRPTAEYIKKLRVELAREFPGITFYFQPSDIVNQILNFGLPAPIDVQVRGAKREENYAIAKKIAAEIQHIPGAVDVHVQQMFDQPTLNVNIDRSKSGKLGITAKDIANSILVSLSSSSQTTPTFWVDPKNGVNYNLAVQSPQYDIHSLQDLENIPVRGLGTSQILSNLADIGRSASPGVISHYDIQQVIDVYAYVQDADLGSVARQVQKIMDKYRPDLPRGSVLTVRGQVSTMQDSFQGLATGMVGAIILVYLLMVVNFQSWTEPFIIITALPGALAGIVWILFLSGTTLNVPSLTGAIMCIGVATANSILVISFAKERFAVSGNAKQAILEAGTTRLRPVIMTASAMIIGMVPMALGFGEGGEQNAPLGRAVIGGLLFATVATLFFVPVVYAMIRGKSCRKGPEDMDGENLEIVE